MPREISEKCRLCAKLSPKEAKMRHGSEGDSCWVGQLCHQRRSHYKNQPRNNSERKRARRALKQLEQLEQLGASLAPSALEPTPADLANLPALPPATPPPATSPQAPAPPLTTLSLPAPGTAAAYIHFYREHKGSPLHALAAELWQGGKKVAILPPIHTLGATESDIRTLLQQVLVQFSKHAGKRLSQFRGSSELHPHQCPIRPCPLHPEPVTDTDVLEITL
jgi:hypothetical protein